jgi:Universal stress protein family
VGPLFAVTGDFASVLDRVANAAKEAGVPCETIQVENVPPHEAIIAAAEDKGCNLIVMSSHGLSECADRKCARRRRSAKLNDLLPRLFDPLLRPFDPLPSFRSWSTKGRLGIFGVQLSAAQWWRIPCTESGAM